MKFNPCFIIPCFKHGKRLSFVLNSIESFQKPCIVVDDGNFSQDQQLIRNSCSGKRWVEIIRLDKNSGKGQAVMFGIKKALSRNFSHGIQVDSDGQHDFFALKALLDRAENFPEDMICGYPEYDRSVPKIRLLGRYITHVWVWIETLSTEIVDSMCGFRIYPLKKTQEIISSNNLSLKMEFDIEILVRLHWAGCHMHFLPVKVHYPKGGHSNFRVLKDNILISWLHMRLFFGMILRLATLVFRKFKKMIVTAIPLKNFWKNNNSSIKANLKVTRPLRQGRGDNKESLKGANS